MHPGEVLGHRPALVALQRADEMPFKIEFGMAGAQGGNLIDPFLHVVLTEGALAAGCGGEDAARVMGLGNGQQVHRFRRTASGLGCSGDALANGLQVGGNCSHNRTDQAGLRRPSAWRKGAQIAAQQGNHSGPRNGAGV